ncbi:hypothetical protein [Cupriavidus sp. RAF12]|uniref:hypothetical protein n=1 Tax=Cupriavidus sp. RAF12 TaxID=3233050 RepID=UPI003F8E005C
MKRVFGDGKCLQRAVRSEEFARIYPTRCRRLILAAMSPGVVMMPGKLSVLSKLAMPRRYTDPAYLQKIGADLRRRLTYECPSTEDALKIQPPPGRG